MISSPTLSPLDQRLQLPNRRKIFAIYALTLLMYTVANPTECNSTLTSSTGEETLTPNPNKCNSTLMSETRGIYPHRYILMLMSGVTAYVFSARRHFILLLFCFVCKKQQQKTKKKTIMIFEFFILSGKNDKQLIQYLLFRP